MIISYFTEILLRATTFSLAKSYVYRRLLRSKLRIRKEMKETAISAHVRPRKFVEAIFMMAPICES